MQSLWTILAEGGASPFNAAMGLNNLMSYSGADEGNSLLVR